ncbi:MAG TPA: glucuronate isomerase [Saprospiraceae bacterium]|nr:glucuronate isomerase [Saprospiraceae bacterium]
MKKFITKHFLLQNKTAKRLYHEFAADLPIIDYHNHLSPEDIANDKQFENITQIWLDGDHYKWRAMRANGVDEHYITGAAKPKEKFKQWAKTVPYTMRNPLYHWTRLELKRYFGIDELLDEKTAKRIYKKTSNKLNTSAYSTQSLLKKMKVKLLCTTDDPTDNLHYHKTIKEGDFPIAVKATFRPDKTILIEKKDYFSYIQQLIAVSGKEISNVRDLIEVLYTRMDYFDQIGCRLSDHGLNHLPSMSFTERLANNAFQKAMNHKKLTPREADNYQSYVLYHLAKAYHEKNWTMQFHLGAIRDNNVRLQRKIGADVGCDSIGDYQQASHLSAFLNRMDSEESLAKTILYNLNPADNEVFATMAGNFNDGSIRGKIQWGTAWWFLDQKDGMEKQINALSNMGLLSCFLGMLTDSRSFLSFPRHEYFRRILCNLIGDDVEKGLLPNDINWLGKMVGDICYHNANNYFEF